jgi:hypothetical protein
LKSSWTAEYCLSSMLLETYHSRRHTLSPAEDMPLPSLSKPQSHVLCRCAQWLSIRPIPVTRSLKDRRSQGLMWSKMPVVLTCIEHGECSSRQGSAKSIRVQSPVLSPASIPFRQLRRQRHLLCSLEVSIRRQHTSTFTLYICSSVSVRGIIQTTCYLARPRRSLSIRPILPLSNSEKLPAMP